MVWSKRGWWIGLVGLALSLGSCGSDKGRASSAPGTPGSSCNLDRDCGAGSCVQGECVGPSGSGSGGPPSVENCHGRPPSGAPGTRSVGDCTPLPFDPSRDPSAGVVVDDSDGAITLDTERSDAAHIWIANTPEATISKFDVRTFEELARYRTGPTGPGTQNGDDPSRTSVNSFGDVYVGNRRGRSLTKISALGERCSDTTGDGSIRTSSGTDDVLPWGQDDCVQWNTPLPDHGLIRGVAAQDVPGPDGVVKSFVWAGGYDGQLWKLDGDTGAVLLETASPVPPYGFALDRAGNLWVVDNNNAQFGRVDTNQCVDNASCDVPVCDGEGTGDGCVKQRITLPRDGYGITVDRAQRVWIGGDTAMRYDPAAAPGSRIAAANLDSMPGGIRIHGIAADAEGWIWGANRDGAGVVRLNGDDLTQWTSVAGTEAYSNKGMAVDADGKIWSITQAPRAVVITPGPGLNDATVNADVARTLVDPYTYSDMTGEQLRLATNPRGFYRRIFEGCPADAGVAVWRELHWDGTVPSGASLAFRVRTAESVAALNDTEWVPLAQVPPIESPVDLAQAFADAGVTPGPVLELDVQLERLPEAASEEVTPRLRWAEVSFECQDAVF